LKNHIKKISVFALIAITASSCSTRRLATNITGDILDVGISAYYEEKDLDLARKGMEANLKLIEVFLKSSPYNNPLKILLAQAYGGFSFVFVETDALQATSPQLLKQYKERATDFYLRGFNYGLTALSDENKNIKIAYETKNIDLFTKEAARLKNKAAIFWTTFNWALVINLNRTNVDLVSDFAYVKILADRMINLDPNYFYGAPLAIKATLECSMPTMFGGRPKIGVEMFKKALEVSKNKLLVIQMLYAQYGTPSVQDKATFNRLVKEVNSADDNILPEFTLLNKAVKVKMPIIAKQTSELFIDEDE